MKTCSQRPVCGDAQSILPCREFCQRALRSTLAFILSFFLQVRVHASETLLLPIDRAPIEMPMNCLREAGVCAVSSSPGHRLLLKWDEVELVLGEQTTLLRFNAQSVRLVRGLLWVKKAGAAFRIDSVYGRIRCEAECWLAASDKQVSVVSTTAAVALRPRGSQKDLQVPPGFANWLGPVGQSGEATSGLPQSYNFHQQMFRWAQLQPGLLKDFTNGARERFEKWSAGIDVAADLARNIASLRQEEHEQYLQKQRLSEQKAREELLFLRRLFREKTFFME